ncbi:hypothetical protein EMCRGX_G031357 [Ephydatia muelleri]
MRLSSPNKQCNECTVRSVPCPTYTTPILLLFIAAVLDDQGGPMIITELLDTTLRKAYEDNLLSPDLYLCMDIFCDVASALCYLHGLEEPIIHRDVSSANVLLKAVAKGEWKAKLSDFGSMSIQPQRLIQSTHLSIQALVPTSSASHKTVKKRTKSLSDLRSVVSAGDTITQLSREVDSCTPEERAKLLEVISSQTGDFRVSISTKDALAMKTELNISWNKLRAMRRWLQMWKIDMSSESHMRVRANDLIGSNIHAEMVPLSFQHKDGGEVIKQAPIASIPHLWDRIVTVLEQNQSNGKLTWHNGVIPSEEIWIKLGGDKGGGTFKFCFQILNVAAPNSTDCTNVISLFEAADSLTNLRICLGQYIQQVADICTRIWRLFSLMEEECHLLDVKNALKASDCGISYTRYHEAQMKRRELMDESQAVKSNIQMMEELLLVNVSLSPEELANHKSVIESICRYICEMKKKESELVNNTATLCNSIVNVAKQHCPSLLCEVEVISQKYFKMFTLFQKCHSTYDKNVVTDAEINTLEQDINNFMQFYRINFPTATVTPKMHILEAHVRTAILNRQLGYTSNSKVSTYNAITVESILESPITQKALSAKIEEHLFQSLLF